MCKSAGSLVLLAFGRKANRSCIPGSTEASPLDKTPVSSLDVTLGIARDFLTTQYTAALVYRSYVFARLPTQSPPCPSRGAKNGNVIQ